jgi:hypothetical protein
VIDRPVEEHCDDLFAWAEKRPTAQVIDAMPAIALRFLARRGWPKPQEPCQEPIDFQRKRGAA